MPTYCPLKGLDHGADAAGLVDQDKVWVVWEGWHEGDRCVGGGGHEGWAVGPVVGKGEARAKGDQDGVAELAVGQDVGDLVSDVLARDMASSCADPARDQQEAHYEHTHSSQGGG